MNQLVSPAYPAQQQQTRPAANSTSQWVSVSFDKVCLATLRHQINRDLSGIGGKTAPVFFTRLQLLDLQRLFTIHPNRKPVEVYDALLMTSDQRELLAVYVTWYYQEACASNEASREWVLADCLDAVTKNAVSVCNPKPTTYDKFSHSAHALAQLWYRLGTVFFRRNQPSLTPSQATY